jgi:protein arginine kinase activator
MECTFCPGNQATCHLTKLVNGNAVEVHVCEKCIPQINDPNLEEFDIWDSVAKLAKQKGKTDPSQSVEPDPVEISAKSLLLAAASEEAIACKACGFTTEDVRKTGRLGCPACYETFSELLQDVLNDCQKSLNHAGKVPGQLKNVRKKRLEEELQKAIKAERFEDAALLRDQLSHLD